MTYRLVIDYYAIRLLYTHQSTCVLILANQSSMLVWIMTYISQDERIVRCQ